MNKKSKVVFKKKQTNLFGTCKRRMTLRKLFRNLQENEDNPTNDNKQITKCVFLGALCLKPVPDIFQVTLQPHTFKKQKQSITVSNINNNNGKAVNNNINKISKNKSYSNKKKVSKKIASSKDKLLLETNNQEKPRNRILELFNNKIKAESISTKDNSIIVGKHKAPLKIKLSSSSKKKVTKKPKDIEIKTPPKSFSKTKAVKINAKPKMPHLGQPKENKTPPKSKSSPNKSKPDKLKMDIHFVKEKQKVATKLKVLPVEMSPPCNEKTVEKVHLIKPQKNSYNMKIDEYSNLDYMEIEVNDDIARAVKDEHIEYNSSQNFCTTSDTFLSEHYLDMDLDDEIEGYLEIDGNTVKDLEALTGDTCFDFITDIDDSSFSGNFIPNVFTSSETNNISEEAETTLVEDIIEVEETNQLLERSRQRSKKLCEKNQDPQIIENLEKQVKSVVYSDSDSIISEKKKPTIKNVCEIITLKKNQIEKTIRMSKTEYDIHGTTTSNKKKEISTLKKGQIAKNVSIETQHETFENQKKSRETTNSNQNEIEITAIKVIDTKKNVIGKNIKETTTHSETIINEKKEISTLKKHQTGKIVLIETENDTFVNQKKGQEISNSKQCDIEKIAIKVFETEEDTTVNQKNIERMSTLKQDQIVMNHENILEKHQIAKNNIEESEIVINHRDNLEISTLKDDEIENKIECIKTQTDVINQEGIQKLSTFGKDQIDIDKNVIKEVQVNTDVYEISSLKADENIFKGAETPNNAVLIESISSTDKGEQNERNCLKIHVKKSKDLVSTKIKLGGNSRSRTVKNISGNNKIDKKNKHSISVHKKEDRVKHRNNRTKTLGTNKLKKIIKNVKIPEITGNYKTVQNSHQDKLTHNLEIKIAKRSNTDPTNKLEAREILIPEGIEGIVDMKTSDNITSETEVTDTSKEIKSETQLQSQSIEDTNTCTPSTVEKNVKTENTQDSMYNKRLHKCKICLEVFDTYNRLKSHKLEHEVKKPYQCKECGKAYSDIDELTSHLRVHQGKMPYQCKKCDNSFWTQHQLEKHHLVHVLKKVTTNDAKKSFKCEVCEKEFRKICDLERHTRVHTGEKPSVCNICNKRFQQAYNLNKHLNIHTQEKNFECVICLKKFGRNDVLNRHVLTHCVDKPHQCSICSKTFIRQSQLNLHIAKHHQARGTK